jgi:dipeptidyl-peptidase-4
MVNRKILALVTLFCAAGAALPAADGAGSLTLETVFAQNLFEARSWEIRPIPAVERFAVLEAGRTIALYDFKTGERIGPLLDTQEIGLGPISDFAFSRDGGRALLAAEASPLFPRGREAQFYLWDRKADLLSPLSRNGRQRLAQLAPDGSKAAFVLGNNLYIRFLENGEEREITNDGKPHEIINGAAGSAACEFDMERAFAWSPDGKKLAYYRFDERRVPQVSIPYYLEESAGPVDRPLRFPRPGEPTAEAQIFVYNCETDAARRMDLGETGDAYFPRIQWTPDSRNLCVTRLNRRQDRLDLLLADPGSGESRQLFSASSSTWIDVREGPVFLPGGRGFLLLEPFEGFNHIALYSQTGRLVRRITSGPWEVRKLHGFDPRSGRAYFTASKDSPVRTAVYSASLDGRGLRLLTERPGWHRPVFSPDFQTFIDTYSTAASPPEISVRSSSGKLIRILEDNLPLRILARDHGFVNKRFFTFSTSDGLELHGWIVEPPDFDGARKYPVLLYVNGEPGSQTVTDAWDPNTAWWQLLARNGILAASVDGRGSGGRGEPFRKAVYLNLGRWEAHDQIEGARHLAGLPYVDAGRIGIFGGGYGGYLAALCLLRGPDVFKLGAASRPVTHWKDQNAVYAERYMRTPRENPGGYRESSPLTYANRLAGGLLLTHGTGDTRVFIRHSLVFSQALVEAGKDFEMQIYTDAGFDYDRLRSGGTRLHFHRRITEFILNNL